MNNIDNSNTAHTVQDDTSEQVNAFFSQLDPQQVEQFYQGYQQWQRQQQVVLRQSQIEMLEKQITDNAVLMQLIQPSPIALATLTRLQSYGVDDVDLLDAMLEHGDTWLDHTLQLLEHCERLDIIHDNYTEWCRHALEGAYDWIDSMNGANTSPSQEQTVRSQEEPPDENTEILLLQKLMSEDETTRLPTIGYTRKNQSEVEIPSILSYSTSIETSANEPGTPVTNANELQTIADASIAAQEELLTAAVDPIATSTSSATSHTTKKRKSPGSGLVSRILAKAWQTQ